MTLVSVIVPVYNVEQFLRRCLDSIKNQSLKDIEIICMNDGSPDGSEKILDLYQKQDKRFVILEQENQGLSMARNNALKHATGKYVCFVDSDDSIDESFLSDMYEAGEKNNADIVMTATRYIQEGKNKTDKLKEEIAESFCDRVKVLPHGSCCNKLYKRKFLKDNNLYFPQGAYWEDNVFTIQACYYANKLVVVNGGCYNYILNSESITQSQEKEEKRKQDSLKIAKKIMEFVSDKKCTYKERCAVTDFCLHNFIMTHYLADKDYLSSIKQILEKTKMLSHKYRKLKRRQLRNKLKGIIRKILFRKS